MGGAWNGMCEEKERKVRCLGSMQVALLSILYSGDLRDRCYGSKQDLSIWE